jgi:hypothetical protein
VRKSFLENQSTTSREASFNVNGQRSAFNDFLLDGLDNNSYGTSNQGFANENIPPSPDAVSEFRLETDNYSAEYGRASGAVINASIRRGTNQFHRRAWDYIRNTDLNAIALCPGRRDKTDVHPQSVWRDLRRADLEGPHLLLHGL